MGYSRSPKVLEAHERALGFDGLKAMQASAWTTALGEAPRVAYRIREALYIARLYPQRFPELAQAAAYFFITTPAPDRVEARPRLTGAVEATLLPGPAPSARVDALPLQPTHGLASHSRSVPTVGVNKAEQVVDAWIKHLPSQDAIVFQQARLSDAELAIIYGWAKARTPKLMLLVGPGTLTLALEELGIEDHAWRPPTPAPTPEVFDL